MRYGRAMLAASAAIVLVDPAASALAQSTSNVLPGDIIVTARKRQESVLKVPIVETVLSSDALEKAQITDIRGVTTKVPGLVIGQSVGTVGAQISLRGIGTSALEVGIDQSVSLNIDGQQFSQGYAFQSGLFDLQQAEVLKGPQALFFGKNSPGGVIALTTADPGDRFEVIGRASYEFEAREKRTELILSGPVSDTLGLRLAGSWSDSDGYFYNTATAIPGQGGLDPADDRYGGNENYIVRGTAVWKPTSNFRARLKVNFTRDSSNGGQGGLQFTSCPNGSGPSLLNPAFQFLGGCTQDRNYELVDMDPTYFGGEFSDGSPALVNGGQPFVKITQRFGVLEMSLDQPTFSITSTSAYYHNSTNAQINGTMSGATGPALFAANRFRREDFTQEFRAESTTNNPFNWMVGAFYQAADMSNDVYVGGNQALGLPARLTAGNQDIGIDSGSLFGQLRWKPVSELELTGGVRWTHERRTNHAFTVFDLGLYESLGIFNPTSGTYNFMTLETPKLTSSNWAPEATITWTPTDQLTVFAAYKTGFKSGSYSITTPATYDKDNSFGDEKVRGGEGGIKFRTSDRALMANIAGYYYKYKGLQVGVSQTSDTDVPVLRTLNAGSARTYGVDFDASYRPPAIPDLGFNLAVNWNKAKYLSLDNVPCYGGQTIALGCNQSLDPSTGLYTGYSGAGETLERAPEWQINGGIDYEIPVGSSLKIALGTSAQYSSRYRTIVGPRDDYFQDSYAKLNGYVTLKDADDAWQLSLIGNNITDVLRAGYCANSNGQDTVVFGRFTQVTGGTTNPTGKIDDVECAVDPGRQVFVRLTVKLGS